MKTTVLGVILLMSLVVARAGAKFLSPQLGEKLFQNKLEISDGYNSKNVRETVFNQWVDHFNFGAGTFKQRIFINDQFYSWGGPVFIYVSSHGGAEEYWLENSFITQIAEEQRGVVYAIEPRFYGNSRPTPDTSLDSLRLLTINQTIADITTISRFLRSALADFGSNRFVVFGYDTGATLATFTHQRNPGLFDGVLASGAPMFVQFDFYMYFYDVQIGSRYHLDEMCRSILSNSDTELEQLILNGEAALITELFNLAQVINLSDSRQVSLLYYISYLLVAYHFEWGNHVDRDDLCQSLVQSVGKGKSDLEALTSYLHPVVSGTNLNWDAIVEYLQQTEWDSEGSRFGERQSWYTTCTEWSWFRTSNILEPAVETRFTDKLFTQLCFDVFGFTHQQVVDANQQSITALSINPALQNVLFTFGAPDPFRLVGITYDLNLWSSALNIPKFGKAFDLMRSIPEHTITPEFIQAQAVIRANILRWIGI